MELVFREKTAEADGIYAFHFTPLEQCTWQAGQSIKLELPAGYDTAERRFTIASAPYEHEIMIATRISNSEFKQALAHLSPGDHVRAYNIDGTFTWGDEAEPHRILCASGVGITPYYSMLRERHHAKQRLMATLYYASHSAEFLFGKELLELSLLHPEFNIQLLPNQRLNVGIITNNKQLAESVIYLSGPSAMVDAIGQELLDQGFPEAQLRCDWFTGRTGWDRVEA